MSSTETALFSAMNFDWYQATIDTDKDQIFRMLTDDVFEIEVKAAKGIAQYDRCEAAFLHDQKLFDVSYGGNQGAKPNVRSTGFYARFIGPEIRKCWPEHRVTRLDVACDFSRAGLFDEIHAFMDKIHHDQNVYRRDFGFASPENGRTFYLGSPKSPMQVRLYEKGLKEIGQGNALADPNWIRLECQYRPRSAEKETYSKIDAEGIWGATRWSRILIGSILDLHPEPIKQEPPMQRDLEEKALYAIQQYRKVFAELGKDRLYEMLNEEIFDKYGIMTEHEKAWSKPSTTNYLI